MQTNRTKQLYYAVIGVQGVCTLYFLWDVVLDFQTNESAPESALHQYSELIVAIGLLSGLMLGVVLLRRLQAERKRAQDQLKVAAGAFAEAAEARFQEWGLTATEREVALYTIKGCSLSEIAGYRGKSAGTIKAQSAAIYRKAGVSSRTHLISLFIEDLIDDPVAKSDL